VSRVSLGGLLVVAIIALRAAAGQPRAKARIPADVVAIVSRRHRRPVGARLP